MREIICIHVGQSGVQIGNTCWELFCLEHGIQPNGRKADKKKEGDILQTQGKANVENESFEAFFRDIDNGQYVPRAIMVDLDPTVIDEVRKSAYGKMFHPECLINDKDDAANIYSRGKYSVGEYKSSVVLDQIRKLVEQCSNIQGFMIFHSIGGGTGSGFTSILSQFLQKEYKEKTKMSYVITPSPQISTSVVEPYNAVLGFHSVLKNNDLSILLDNQSLYSICQSNLGVERPTYTNINRLISQVVSAMTTSLRFDGSLNVDLYELQTNLVPYHRLNLMQTSYAPICSNDKMYHQMFTTKDITSSLFEPQNMMIKANPRHGKYMASTLMYRGDVIPSDVNVAIQKAINQNSNVRFVDWSPTGFKVGINFQPPTVIPNGDIGKSMRSACMIANSTSVNEVLRRICHKSDMLFAKRAFIHWFNGEGMEQGELVETREQIAALLKDYEEVAIDSAQ